MAARNVGSSSESTGEARRGGCQCGAVRYRISGEAEALYVCHCRECRKQSASAFGISLIVPRAAFRVTQGFPKFWQRPTDTGNRLNCAFCPDCGARLWHERDGGGETVSVKGGSMDETIDLGAAVHTWTSRSLPGVVIPEGAQCFPEEPE